MEHIPDKIYYDNLKKDIESLECLRGLKIYGDRRIWFNPNPRIKIAVNTNTDRQNIADFIDSIPQDFQIMFFDNSETRGPDPGAIVYAKPDKDNFLYFSGNHGWKSAWKTISKDNLVSFIYRNRGYTTNDLEIFRSDD
jgi:hypothetical protein